MGGKTGRLTAAGYRSNRHTVNLTDAEEELWQAGFAATEHREFGVWVRAAVNDAIGRPGLGEVPRVPEVNHGAYMALVRVGNDLNQLTRAVHSGGLPADLLPRLAAAIEAVGDAALVVRGLRPVGDVDQDDEDQAVEDVEPLGPGTWVDPA